MTPIRVRFPLGPALTFVVVGLLLLGAGVVAGSLPQLVAGPLTLLLGVLQLVGVAIVVEPHEVQVRNPLQMTVRRVPIVGLADLRRDGPKLLRAGDGARITGVGAFSARSADVEVLREAISRAAAVA